jgi:dTDP-4-amino-4,6-dideoxygalactose transaminase
MAHGARYNSLLGKLGITPPATAPGSEHSYHVYAVRVKNRDAVRERLSAAGVDNLVHYPKAVPFLGAYAYKKHTEADFPHAVAHANSMISLPMFPELTAGQQDYVVTQLAQAIREA